jgi:hypothetical protein
MTLQNTGRKETPWGADAYNIPERFYGLTPTEAVARLWLVLNNSNTNDKASS